MGGDGRVDRIGAEAAVKVNGQVVEAGRVGHVDGAVAPHSDGLELFAPHHRAQPAAGSRALGSDLDAGEAHQVLTGRADGGRLDLRVAPGPADGSLRL